MIATTVADTRFRAAAAFDAKASLHRAKCKSCGCWVKLKDNSNNSENKSIRYVACGICGTKALFKASTCKYDPRKAVVASASASSSATTSPATRSRSGSDVASWSIVPQSQQRGGSLVSSSSSRNNSALTTPRRELMQPPPISFASIEASVSPAPCASTAAAAAAFKIETVHDTFIERRCSSSSSSSSTTGSAHHTKKKCGKCGCWCEKVSSCSFCGF